MSTREIDAFRHENFKGGTIDELIKKMSAGIDYEAIEREGLQRLHRAQRTLEEQANNAKEHFAKKFK
jgi:hypothetical protein